MQSIPTSRFQSAFSMRYRLACCTQQQVQTTWSPSLSSNALSTCNLHHSPQTIGPNYTVQTTSSELLQHTQNNSSPRARQDAGILPWPALHGRTKHHAVNCSQGPPVRRRPGQRR